MLAAYRNRQRIVKSGVVVLGLLIVAYLAYFVRAGTLNSPTVLDYDPWWFYRHAEEIVKNDFKAPSWDLLSYYPPGRPNDIHEGWPYTIATFYKISSMFSSNTLTDVAKLSPIIMVILTILPAFLLGRLLTNKWGGLVTALLAVLTPSLISVTMGGYSDSDAPVNFLFFLSIYLIVKTLKKPSIPNYAMSVLANLFFAFSWNGGWFPLILFILFIPAFLIFRVVESMVLSRKMKVDYAHLKPELISIIKPLLIILAVDSALGQILGLGNPFTSMLVSLGFVFGEGLIVNVSVAELQPINILTKEGFLAIASRVGMGPFLLSLVGVPAIVFYRFAKKIKTNFMEVFLIAWWIISYILISRGVRFSLLFSIATAVGAGYVVAHIIRYLHKRQLVYMAFACGIIGIMLIMFVSDGISSGYSNTGLQISQNWYDALNWLKTNADRNSLVTTWWDPGHIIAGYTGLKVHADGAHCSPEDCVPYNHNIRIKDAGKLFSTSSEDESLSILAKYKQLTPSQCDRVKKTFGSIVPPEACNPVSDMYVIASSDLIGKYYWLSYFGMGNGKNFLTVGVSGQKDGDIIYGDPNNGVGFVLTQKNNSILPLVVQKGNAGLVKNLAIPQNGQVRVYDFGQNNTNYLDGMLWVDGNLRNVIFMEPALRDSVFTKMFFFDGVALKNFELVFQNQEVKIFKAKFNNTVAVS